MSYTIYGRHSKATIIRDKQDYDKLYVNIVLHSRVIPRFPHLFYRAPAPYDNRCNGNGPFPNLSIAYFKNNPNEGYAKIENNKARFVLNHPNSFYINAGTKLIPPHIYIRFGNSNLDDYFDDEFVLKN